MGYGSVYGNRDEHPNITGEEVRYLDRLFSKALVNTDFGKTSREANVYGWPIMERVDGAEKLYQHTGMIFFGDNWFAFRKISDTKEYRMSLGKLQSADLLQTSKSISEKLKASIEQALVDVEGLCIPSNIKPDAVYRSSDFKSGAWQVYAEVRKFVPDILSHAVSRATIKRRYDYLQAKQNNFDTVLGSLKSYIEREETSEALSKEDIKFL
ncbi:MAG TPA: hypothetical protein VJH34_03350 [archaeon]|nr:hypothetical protein [archaeon]